ncbi:hypothetical protein Ciccas_003136 [Cichlidogyrus casuarinus]|uniref:Uncharacterized protein n=1 Tax=Cichlidogyrus casuarinus TaxID=1844966 RepID=A0ABD2QFP7_9PLAT
MSGLMQDQKIRAFPLQKSAHGGGGGFATFFLVVVILALVGLILWVLWIRYQQYRKKRRGMFKERYNKNADFNTMMHKLDPSTLEFIQNLKLKVLMPLPLCSLRCDTGKGTIDR